ncbi:segregation and condensation protein A [Natronomonas sp.]|uniref:segregation and condensation protein A n=1 Tax=Natronomonas sp. TaxID=2184060 RepID=UPI0026123FE1|nr:ScpA family protein [Natronomonas sp.]
MTEGADGSAGDGEDATEEIPLNIAGHESDREADGDESERAEGPVPSAEGVLSSFDVSDLREADDEELEPVELLVQLAEDGEIDPWDIDVVTVTDKFLNRLDEADLRTGGRALFYASVLLRMKSDAMWNDPDEEAEPGAGPGPEPEPWDAPGGGGRRPADPAAEADPFARLEDEIDRRIDRKRARGMPETLDELVRDLRERERDTWWKSSREYDTSESPSGFARGTQTLDYHGTDEFRMDDEPTAEEVTGRTHDEHMEDVINDVYRRVQRQYDEGREEVLFAEIETAGGTAVNTFLGLLFLAHRGRIRLEQDDLFGDLWIRDPSAVGAEEPAPADD